MTRLPLPPRRSVGDKIVALVMQAKSRPPRNSILPKRYRSTAGFRKRSTCC